MSVVVPRSLSEALEALNANPLAQVLAGGTDFMVEVNAGHRRPGDVVSIRRLDELKVITDDGSTVRIGAGVAYSRFGRPEISDRYPALAAAARTVGSPQIRNAGTLGGNVGTASPAGDTLPVLAALNASIRLARHNAPDRVVPWNEFFVGVKRTSRQPGELITSIDIPRIDSRQDYLKVGTRNAMVISVAGCCVVVDITNRAVRVGLGSVGPVPIRATDAEAFATAHIDWDELRLLGPGTADAFGHLVADAARPIDDHRSRADYRRHAIEVLARRALQRLL